MAPSVGCDAGGCSRWACLACAGFRSEAEAGRKTWFCTLHAPAVAVATEAEGLRLHLSSSSSTGYKNVFKDGSRFKVEHRVDGRQVRVGSFDTAVEAAVAYARAVGEEGPAPLPHPAKRPRESAAAPVPTAPSSAPAAAAASSASPFAPSAPSLPPSRLFELLPDGRTVHKEAPPDNGGMAAVAAALERVGLENYVAAFDAEGYDDIEFLGGLDAAERAGVAKDVGMKQGHLSKFVKHGFEARS